ncbi:MAG: TRAP transporter permease [Burkholderiaceae bacterium]
MTTANSSPPASTTVSLDGTIDAELQKKLDELIEEEEGAQSKFKGWIGVLITLALVAMSLVHLYAAYGIIPASTLRPLHVAMVISLVFLIFPATTRFRNRIMWWDILVAAFSLFAIYYLWSGGEDLLERNTAPSTMDLIVGVGVLLTILEALRRTNGWILLSITLLFLCYALFGNYLPEPWTHRGYSLGRLVGHMYMTLEGIYGSAIDVSSSLIILFTIFGAFLQFTGAGKFFIDWSFSVLGGRPSNVGRTIVLSSFLLGGPSGSGVATTVTVGSVAGKMLQEMGYEKNAAGGLLAAGGLGAIISPPVLGAAAFLIADFLGRSYMDVLVMATIPTILFYLGLFVMVEIDSRKYGMAKAGKVQTEPALQLATKYWFHFFSLISIVVFMLIGFSPIASVFWATVLSALTSMLRPETAVIPWDLFKGKMPLLKGLYDSKLVHSLAGGTREVLGIASVCAGAGLIVGVVTLTGLGLKFSSIVLDLAGGSLLLTAVYTALIVWIVGLAVPVTASYIICAVIAAPALIKLGVPDFAAHMFIFYYAVLSEVSPPTALSPFAAAAICKGNPYKTTLQSWKYVAPAILVPFMFVLDPSGLGLLLMGSMKALEAANWVEIGVVSATAALGIVCLAGGLQGWFIRKTNLVERWLMILSGLALTYPGTESDLAGLAGFILAIGLQWMRRNQPPDATMTSGT